MEIIYIINAILLSVAVSLGVGCSTVAITQFFVAINDGQIDQTERKLLGAVYIILRVAMVAILLTLLVQAGIFYSLMDGFGFLSPFMLSMWSVVGVLYLNAIGMTMHWIPSKIGPAIQAGSWYTLGVLLALIPLGQITFGYTQFLLVYAGVILLAIAAISVVRGYLMSRQALSGRHKISALLGAVFITVIGA